MRLKYCSETRRRFWRTRSRLSRSYARLGQVGDGVAGGAEQRELLGVESGAERIEGFLALAAIADEADLTEEGELGRDSGLGHAEDFLKLGDGELLFQQERQQAQARGIGEDFQVVPGGVHNGPVLCG
jgi:hypothetical protein